MVQLVAATPTFWMKWQETFHASPENGHILQLTVTAVAMETIPQMAGPKRADGKMKYI